MFIQENTAVTYLYASFIPRTPISQARAHNKQTAHNFFALSTNYKRRCKKRLFTLCELSII